MASLAHPWLGIRSRRTHLPRLATVTGERTWFSGRRMQPSRGPKGPSNLDLGVRLRQTFRPRPAQGNMSASRQNQPPVGVIVPFWGPEIFRTACLIRRGVLAGAVTFISPSERIHGIAFSQVSQSPLTRVSVNSPRQRHLAK